MLVMAEARAVWEESAAAGSDSLAGRSAKPRAGAWGGMEGGVWDVVWDTVCMCVYVCVCVCVCSG